MTRIFKKKQSRRNLIYSSENHIKYDLKTKGFSYIPSQRITVTPDLAISLYELVSECADLPVDPYCETGNRFRRFGKGTINPETMEFEFSGKSIYSQPAFLNPVDGGVRREFAPLTQRLKENAFLQELIFRDFAQCPFTEEELEYRIACNLHLIKYYAGPNSVSMASPNQPHQDGEWITYIHLLQYERVKGGGNLVTDLKEQPIFEITLKNLMDTVVVKDDQVKHHVFPVEVADGCRSGWRLVLLTDFTPMVPSIRNYGN